jgi:REP element-mobilizing transposase RayT
MAEVQAFHVVFGTHGSWLPNDPRGSKSTEVRAANLREFGEATWTQSRRSVAGAAHDRGARRRAKQALVYPEVFFTNAQEAAVGRGFAEQVAKSGYTIHACSILTQHIHLVIRRHHYDIEQVVRLLRQAATAELLSAGLHPFAALRGANGRLPSVWAQDFWKVFLFHNPEVAERVTYVENNPIKEGRPPQRWPFVTPFVPESG